MGGNASVMKSNKISILIINNIIILHKKLSLLLLLFIFAISGCGEKQDWNADKRFKPFLEPGAVAHDFLSRTTEDKFIPFYTYSGHPILLSFFKKSCDECVPTLKMLENVHKNYADGGLIAIAINVDNLNYVQSSAVLSHVKNIGLSYMVLLDDQSMAIGRYRVISLPVTFFINKEMIISYIAHNEEDLLSPENRARIEKMMKE